MIFKVKGVRGRKRAVDDFDAVRREILAKDRNKKLKDVGALLACAVIGVGVMAILGWAGSGTSSDRRPYREEDVQTLRRQFPNESREKLEKAARDIRQFDDAQRRR